MQRLNKSAKQESIKPVWKKISRGTLYPFPKQRNVRVKPFEKIQATEEEIAKYRDQFELVKDGTGDYKVKPTKAEPKPEPALPEEYKLVEVGENQFNVVSSSGKVMNGKKPLFEDEAQQLKDQLEEVQEEE